MFLARTLPTGHENAGQDAIKLFHRQVLAHVTVRSCTQRGVHFFLLVTDAGKDDDRQPRSYFVDVGNERNAVDFRHVEINHHHFTIMRLEPGVRLETFGQGGAGVTFLSEVGGKELSDRQVVINDEEFYALAIKQFHRQKVSRWSVS